MDITTVSSLSGDVGDNEEQQRSETLEPALKRRKLRKGTHSCWDCKKRKVRCTFATDSDIVCIACKRRGVDCVSQELPDAQPEEYHEPAIKRMPEAENQRPSPTAALYWATELRNTATRGALPGAGKYKELSRTLHATFPSQKDIDILCKAGHAITAFFHRLEIKSINTLKNIEIQAAPVLLQIPSPDTHPVLLAKRMLILALYLQSLPPPKISGLSEDPRKIMKKLANTAINLVTTNEELLGAAESLECIVLEGIFQGNSGNLRRAWLAFRRAMNVAQMMGIHRVSSSAVESLDRNPREINAQFIWFRIIYMDRFLCLLLGLPPGTPNTTITSDDALANNAPICNLQRTHAVIAARLLERNEHTRSIQEHYATTQSIDAMLLKASSTLPTKFWLAPDLSNADEFSPASFWLTARLLDQLFHYSLLNLLHLPYLLRYIGQHAHDYSRVACTTASRELLIRFASFSTFDRVTTCCRPAAFLALMAALTLLLAHLDSHHRRGASSSDNLLAHQRPSDRAVVEQVLDNMEVATKEKDDVMAGRSAGLLRRLMEVETDAARGHRYSIEKVRKEDVKVGEDGQPSDDEEGAQLLITMPYFGTIRIARERVILGGRVSVGMTGRSTPATTQEQSAAPSSAASTAAASSTNATTVDGTGSVHVANHVYSMLLGPLPLNSWPVPENALDGNLSATSHQQQRQSADASLGELNDVLESVELQLQGSSALYDDHNSTLEHDLGPSLAADIDDWAFQGVDSAFFECLMNGIDSVPIGEVGPNNAECLSVWDADLNTL